LSLIQAKKENRPHFTYRLIVYINSEVIVNKKRIRGRETKRPVPDFLKIHRFLAGFSRFLACFLDFFRFFSKFFINKKVDTW